MRGAAARTGSEEHRVLAGAQARIAYSASDEEGPREQVAGMPPRYPQLLFIEGSEVGAFADFVRRLPPLRISAMKSGHRAPDHWNAVFFGAPIQQLERASGKQVIGVGELDVRSRREADAKVSCRPRTAILGGSNHSDAAVLRGVACQDGGRSIGRGIVDTHYFDVSKRLREHRIEAVRQLSGLVENGHDHADAWRRLQGGRLLNCTALDDVQGGSHIQR